MNLRSTKNSTATGKDYLIIVSPAALSHNCQSKLGNSSNRICMYIFNLNIQEIEECFTVALDEVVQVVENCRDSADYEEFKAALKLATMFKKEHIQEFIILIEPGDEIFRTYPILDINVLEN